MPFQASGAVVDGRRLLLAKEFTQFDETCSHIPLVHCSSLSLGKVLPHLSVCSGFHRLSRFNNIRIRLLQNCACLESETCRFRNVTWAARENFVAPVLRELFTSLPSVPPSHQCATFFLPAVSPLSYPLTFNYSLTTFSGLSGSTTPSFKERLYASHIIFILPALITCQLSHPHHPPNRLRSFSVDYKEEENGKCTTFMLAATDIYISISLSTTYARFPRIRSPMCNRIVTVTYLNQKNCT